VIPMPAGFMPFKAPGCTSVKLLMIVPPVQCREESEFRPLNISTKIRLCLPLSKGPLGRDAYQVPGWRGDSDRMG
jgi:hypothetical protein